MPKITFISHDGNNTELQVESGITLMQAAVDNGVDGIIGDCGGACSCATCHCYIDESWAVKTGTADANETDMLECVLNPTENSRLSCQITLGDEHDGLIVTLPESQY